jgi:hypothetical protein
MVLTTDKDLLDNINEFYGHSIGSQRDLAKELGVSPRMASCLTQEAGYHRHKLDDPKKPVLLADFIKQPCAAWVIKTKGLQKYEEKAS